MSFFGIPIRNSLGLGLGGVIPLSMRPSPVVPVLALDFVNQSYAFGVNTKSFSDVITFTRADATTCATRVNASGVLETVAANVPRFDYDPVTLAPKGFLIEETRRNLLLNSAIAGTNLTTQSVTVTAVAHSLSFYGTGTITLSGTSTGSLVGSGAYPTRSTLTFTPTAGSLTLTVTGTVQFAQLEIGAFPTSFIVTGASAATRNYDVTSMTGTNLTSWFNQSPGTIVGDANISVAGVDKRLLSLKNVGITNMAALRRNASNLPTLVFRNPTGEDLANSAFTTGRFKIGGSWEAGSTSMAFNGVLATRANTVVPSTVDTLVIGFDGGAAGFLNDTIRSIKYYNTKLTNAQLTALTT